MDSRLPKPSRIVTNRTRNAPAVKENIARNIGKLTSATIADSLNLVKPRTEPLTLRSKTVEDIKATLANKKPTVAAPVRRPLATTKSAPPAKVQPGPRVANATAKKPVAAAEKPKVATKRIPPYDYKARFADLSEKHKALKDKHEELRDQLQHFDEMPEQFEQCKGELAKATIECSELKAQLQTVQRENMELKSKNESLVDTVQDLRSKLEYFEKYCPKLEAELAGLKESNQTFKVENVELQGKVESLQNELGLCADQLFATNMERKTLHNEVKF